MSAPVSVISAEHIHGLAKDHFLIDARSPSEFLSGHLPGAYNVPILNDEQRHLVGICYKQRGNEAAVELGFELAGGDFARKIRTVKDIANGSPVIVYCWRGGQRSAILSWILSAAGITVQRLGGGYKAFRNQAYRLFSEPHHLIMLTGKTGSGKTELLHELRKRAHSIIDLEGIANHRGSSFGGIGMPPQPTQEHFENLLAWELSENLHKLIWIEGESRFIGKIRIPDNFYLQMQRCRSVQLERLLSSRVNRVLAEYGQYERNILKEKTVAITKRMGGDRVKLSIEALDNGNMEGWLIPLLDYYDRTYMHSIEGRAIRPHCISAEGRSTEEIISEIIEYGKNAPR
jgi:tRNA 2-selenouridine synthase